jgi:hypothetical protein
MIIMVFLPELIRSVGSRTHGVALPRFGEFSCRLKQQTCEESFRYAIPSWVLYRRPAETR